MYGVCVYVCMVCACVRVYVSTCVCTYVMYVCLNDYALHAICVMYVMCVMCVIVGSCT